MNLLKLEMMDATARIAEALQMRGLFLRATNSRIVLTEENTRADITKVRELLQELSVPTLWDGNTFEVLVNQLPIAVMKRIMHHAPGNEFPVSMQAYHYQWRAFAQRRFGIKVNALDLDANIAMLVKSLNAAGIVALAGCNGHRRYEPNIQLSGVFHGAWFEVIQERFLSDCPLYYSWKVHYGNGSGSCIFAQAKDDEEWDMNRIYYDTVQMAQLLQRHAADIRRMKKEAFKRDGEMKQQATRFMEEMQYEELVDWMRDKMQGNFSTTI